MKIVQPSSKRLRSLHQLHTRRPDPGRAVYMTTALIAPALYRNEKTLVVPFVALTTVGAIGGAAFSHDIMFPYMIAFFGTFNSPDLAFMPRVDELFDLYTKMLVGMVVVFQIPTMAFFLAKMRMVTAGFGILVVWMVQPKQ